MNFLAIIALILLLLLNYSYTAKRARVLAIEAEHLFRESKLLLPDEPRFEFVGATATIVARRSNSWQKAFSVGKQDLYMRIYARNESGEYFQFTRVENDQPMLIHLPQSVARSIIGKEFFK